MLKNRSFIFPSPTDSQHMKCIAALSNAEMLPIGPKAHNIAESTHGTSKEDTPTWGGDTPPLARGYRLRRSLKLVDPIMDISTQQHRYY